MAKVTITNLYAVDVEKTNKRIHEVMVQFTKDTLVEWVTHTTQPIPIWSGATRATFIKLANQVQFNIDISPIVSPPSVGNRSALGIGESKGEIIANFPQYGWIWESTLDYTGVVESNVGFIEIGEKAIADKRPQLPQPVRKVPGPKG